LLLADEPTANVDAANQQKIIELIRQTCKEEDIALIMVTHDLKLAQQFPRVERLEQLNRVLQSVTT
jgi:putative ABC transport system ATP-binding protein